MNGKKQRTRDVGHEGFSLVELLIVVAIIAITAGVAAPNILAYMRNYSVRSGTSLASAEIQRARQKAVQRNTNNGIIFVITSRRQFRVYPEDANPDQLDGNAIPISVRQGFNQANTDSPPRYLPDWVEFVPGGAAGQLLRFNRLGQACQPQPGPGPCPWIVGAIPIPMVPGTTTNDGSTVDANYFTADGSGGWTVLIEDIRTRPGGTGGTPGTGIRRLVSISGAGRVQVQQ